MALLDILGIGTKLIDKLIPDPQAKAEAQLKLAELASEGKLAELTADNTEQQELTKRMQADMSSDSWLAKNIRPLTLLFILSAYTMFASLSIWDLTVNEEYVKLLGSWGMLIMSFYFGGRSLEKIMDRRKDK